jgi:hypothetical protein
MINAQLEQSIVSLIQADAAIPMPFHAFSTNPSIVKKIDQGLGVVLYRGSDNDDASGVNYTMVKKNQKCMVLFYSHDIELIHATLERCYNALLGKQPSPDHDPIIVLSDSVDLQDSGLFEGMMLVETSVYVIAV